MSAAFIQSDLATFFDEFAVDATPAAGEAFPVIFDNAFIAALTGRVESTQPMCVAKTSDVQAFGDGAGLTINGAAYTVKTNEPDGTGISLLTIWKA